MGWGFWALLVRWRGCLFRESFFFFFIFILYLLGDEERGRNVWC